MKDIFHKILKNKRITAILIVAILLTVVALFHSIGPKKIYAKDYITFRSDGSYVVDYDKLQADLGGEGAMIDAFDAMGVFHSPGFVNASIKVLLEITDVSGRYEVKDNEYYLGFRPKSTPGLARMEEVFKVKFIDQKYKR